MKTGECPPPATLGGYKMIDEISIVTTYCHNIQNWSFCFQPVY